MFRARILAMIAALLFSTGGAGIKTGAFSALQVSSGRSGIAALTLLVLMRGRCRINAPILATATAYAACVTLFVGATRLTTAANAIFLQSTAPLYLLVLGPWLLREPLPRRDLAYAPVMAAGLAICFIGQPAPSITAPDPANGNLLALGSSLAWAAVLVGLRHVARSDRRGNGAGEAGDAMSAVILGNALAAMAGLPFSWPFPAAGATAWALLIYLGLVQIALAYFCLTRAIARVPAFEVSLLLLLEPVLNPVWTWLLRGEHPGPLVLIGGACVLAGSAMRAWRRA